MTTKIPMHLQVPYSWRHSQTLSTNQVSSTYPHTHAEWANEMAEMLKSYLRGEDIYVELTRDPKRVGSIAKIKFDNVQAMLGNHYFRYGYNSNSTPIDEKESNVDPQHFRTTVPSGKVRWDGRTNRKTVYGSEVTWLKGYKGETNWVYEKPALPPAVIPKDKLDRDIKVGDFISYILYHFGGNNGNAAGIYYGKVTKIENDGTVYAKNIKLKDNDVSAEKRIKDNSLIVLMTKDLMDKLMLARLSIL